MLCEMQLVSSRIRTRIVVSNSYDDNHYTKGTSVGSFKFCLTAYQPLNARRDFLQCMSLIRMTLENDIIYICIMFCVCSNVDVFSNTDIEHSLFINKTNHLTLLIYK